MSENLYILHTRKWVEKIVIGLNLCPFSKQPFVTDRIRYEVYEGTDIEMLTGKLAQELLLLAETPAATTETTLLIFPNLLLDFMDYNDYLDIADSAVDQLGLEGTIQVASFHPAYQFDGTNVFDIENYTNRSPYPMLHLIREESIEKAVDSFPDVDTIPIRNIATMKNLGFEGLNPILEQINQKP